jgi:hypothetical protein
LRAEVPPPPHRAESEGSHAAARAPARGIGATLPNCAIPFPLTLSFDGVSVDHRRKVKGVVLPEIGLHSVPAEDDDLALVLAVTP